jgi:hypothetical protein
MVLVPEAPVHENNGTSCRKYQIRLPGKVSAVQAESEAKRMGNAPNY